MPLPTAASTSTCIVRAADDWHYFFIHRRYDLWDRVGTTAGSTIGNSGMTGRARERGDEV